MPDPDIDVELPVEDAVEQEQDVVEEPLVSPPPPPPRASEVLEADEADVVEQESVVEYSEDDYR